MVIYTTKNTTLPLGDKKISKKNNKNWLGILVHGKKLISSMPHSAQKVYRILRAGKRMRIRDIESQIQYSPRMVRYALRHLKNEGLITRIKGPWWYYYSINN